MDVFGLGSIIQKVEDYFGKRVTGALLITVLITAFILCANAIISFGVIPLIQFAQGVGSKSVVNLLRSLAVAVLAGLATALVAHFVFRLLSRRIIARAEQVVRRADELLRDVSEVHAETKALAAEAQALIQTAKEDGPEQKSE